MASVKDIVLDMSDGNPGAMRVLLKMMELPNWEKPLLWMKKNGYVSDKIWMLYKDDHKEDLLSMFTWVCEQIKKEEK